MSKRLLSDTIYEELLYDERQNKKIRLLNDVKGLETQIQSYLFPNFNINPLKKHINK